MRSRWLAELRLCLPVLILVALTASLRAQSPPPLAWWKDAQFQKDLGLTAEQSSRIDAVYQGALPQLHREKNELDAQEAELSRLIEMTTDEVVLGRQIDRIETVRAALNKGRTLMLLRMRQVLTPDQRVKFKMLRDRWNQEHRSPQRRDDSK
jgi:Spy/CpxP family protein refolding chaperone